MSEFEDPQSSDPSLHQLSPEQFEEVKPETAEAINDLIDVMRPSYEGVTWGDGHDKYQLSAISDIKYGERIEFSSRTVLPKGSPQAEAMQTTVWESHIRLYPSQGEGHPPEIHYRMSGIEDADANWANNPDTEIIGSLVQLVVADTETPANASDFKTPIDQVREAASELFGVNVPWSHVADVLKQTGQYTRGSESPIYGISRTEENAEYFDRVETAMSRALETRQDSDRQTVTEIGAIDDDHDKDYLLSFFDDSGSVVLEVDSPDGGERHDIIIPGEPLQITPFDHEAGYFSDTPRSMYQGEAELILPDLQRLYDLVAAQGSPETPSAEGEA